MHQNPTLILTILPQLESTSLLEIPHLADLIASLVNTSSPMPETLSSLSNPAPFTLGKDLTCTLDFNSKF